MKKTYEGKIVRKEWLAPDVFLLEVEKAPDSEPVYSGQFYNIQCGEGIYPLLRRPISVSRVHENTLEFIIFKKGKGTELLAMKEVGQNLGLMGPLGNTYTLPESGGRHLVLGGGIGIAPQRELVAQLAARNPEKLTVLMGFRSKSYGMKLYHQFAHEVRIATEDGSEGTKGYVTELLKEELENGPWDGIYACGPHGMLIQVAHVAEAAGNEVQLLMEERMACGIGACLVCVCKVHSEDAPEGYENVRTCKEGPVFSSKEVILHG